MTDGLRSELERQGEALASLRAEHPGHKIWTEALPERPRLRFVARSRPGAAASPWLVMTDDLAELRAVLADAKANHR